MATSKILIVDDATIISRELEYRLTKLGYIVAGIAVSGEEAIRLAEETAPDLVLMDVVLKGDLDGIDAAAEIRKRRSVPVIYLTADTDEATLQRARITEPFGYVVKPCSERELRANIEMALYKHQVEGRLLEAQADLERQVRERTVALQESEERFRTVVEAAPNGMLMVGPDGNINLVNVQVVKMFGYAAHELIGQSVEVLVPEQFRAQHPAHRQQYFSDPHTRVMGGGRELFGRRKDGSEFPVEIGLNPIQLDEGHFVLAAIIDVTERHRAAGEHRRLAGLLDQAYDPSLAWTIHGPIVFWNRSAEELYGYSKREANGTTSHQLLQTVFPEGVTPAGIEAQLSRNGRWEGELIHTAKDGRRITVESRMRIMGDSAQPLVLEANRDITRRKQAEVALRDSEAKFHQLADTIPQLAWMADPDGHIYWYNQQWYDYTGTTPEAMEGWGWQSVHDPAVLPKVLERWRSSIATGQPFEMVFPLRGIDGGFRSFLTRVAPLRSPEGQILQWFGTNTDVSEQMEMEEALRQSKSELEVRVRERTAAAEDRAQALTKSEAALREQTELMEASLQEKELLLKEIHHRVKNNLQIVSTLLDLQSSHTQDKQALEMFQESRGRVRSMALIHERLYRSRNLVHVDFVQYVQQLAADMYYGYRLSNDEIVLDVDVDVPEMSIDIAIPCGLIINELMSNALKHAFADASEGCLRVALRRINDNTTVLTVADTGAGFPDGLDFRHTTSFGLQLVNTLVEQLHGEIQMKIERGTVFTVTFPDMR